MANYHYDFENAQIKNGGGKLYGIFVSGTNPGVMKVGDIADADHYPFPANYRVISEVFNVVDGGMYLDFNCGIDFVNGLYIDLEGDAFGYTVIYE